VRQALVKTDGKAKIEGYFGELGFRARKIAARRAQGLDRIHDMTRLQNGRFQVAE
jgi:hypothetical protein